MQEIKQVIDKYMCTIYVENWILERCKFIDGIFVSNSTCGLIACDYLSRWLIMIRIISNIALLAEYFVHLLICEKHDTALFLNSLPEREIKEMDFDIFHSNSYFKWKKKGFRCEKWNWILPLP